MNLLFVCSKNRLRSATAEEVFSSWPGIEAVGAGTNKDAPTTVSGDLIEWADHILVMEPTHRARLTKRFGALLRHKQLTVLGVPDRFEFMDPELIALLERRVRAIVRL